MTKFKKIVLALVALVISSTAIQAKTTDSTNGYSVEEPFSVKYMGNEGNYLLFEVTVNSGDSRNSSFEISDKNEGEIYTANIKSARKVQTLKIEKRDNQELDFKLVVGKEVYSRSFAILSNVSLEKK